MGDEGTCSGASVDDLEHGGLQLQVVAAVEVLAQGAHDGGAGAHHVTGGRAGEQVELTAAHAVVLGQGDGLALVIGPGLGQRPQGLGGDAPGRDLDGVVAELGQLLGGVAGGQGGLSHDGQLAAARGDDAAVDEEVVAQVDVGLEGGQARVTLAGQVLGGDHGLQGPAGAVGQGNEAQLARGAQEGHAPGHAYDVVSLLAGLQVAVALADSLDGGGDGHLDRVGLPALGAQAFTLGGADLELLARAGLGLGLLLGRLLVLGLGGIGGQGGRAFSRVSHGGSLAVTGSAGRRRLVGRRRALERAVGDWCVPS